MAVEPSLSTPSFFASVLSIGECVRVRARVHLHLHFLVSVLQFSYLVYIF